MPFKYELTWIEKAKKWRKQYQGKRFYLKTTCNGKRDRAGYLAALREWERLRAWLDGLGPSPYTATGALIPEPTEETESVQSIAQMCKAECVNPTPVRLPDDPDWILCRGIFAGLHSDQILSPDLMHSYNGNRRISDLSELWLDRRKSQAERGELSLKQWAEDQAKLETFRNFMQVNFQTVRDVDQIDARMLNAFRSRQWELVDRCEIKKPTLKKRLDTVSKWLRFLVDESILAELPKDLTSYGKVSLDKPQPKFWTVEEIKQLAKSATERTRLYVMLALNLGYTQMDIATLEGSMVDWESGIIRRERHKSGVASKSKLWPTTLALLKSHRNPGSGRGPILLNQNGKPLLDEKVNENGKLIVNDSIRLAFDRRKRTAGFESDKRSFKHLRKTAANEIEKVAPHLTELFLAHGEKGTKRFYVETHYHALFEHTDNLESLFGFAG